MFPSLSRSQRLKRTATSIVNEDSETANRDRGDFPAIRAFDDLALSNFEYDFQAADLIKWLDLMSQQQPEVPHEPLGIALGNHSQTEVLEPEDGSAPHGWWQEYFLEQWALVPTLGDRTLYTGLVVPNPYAMEGEPYHPKLGLSSLTSTLFPASGSNGLLKFSVLRNLGDESTFFTSTAGHSISTFNRAQQKRRRHPFANPEQLQYLPPNFGREIELNPLDSKLLKFYIIAFCTGRTILPESNSLLRDITPMAEKSRCVMSALLALSATYILDFQPSEQLGRVANWHHREAVRLLGDELNKQETYEPGNEDAVIGTIVLLNQDDTVNWEFRDKEALPKWFHGDQTAISILHRSDPGYKYANPKNVQKSAARRHLGSMCAEDAVFAAVIAPLKVDNMTTRQYLWLLEGDENELSRIGGLIGMCPKLLHIFSQITHLCARLDKDPTSKIIPLGVKPIERKLPLFLIKINIINSV